ncbi:hypothetical protein R7O11_24610, partial [Vibrio sp. Vb2362]|nr:hypothetical protein [Vibrio sp. Vb2362]
MAASRGKSRTNLCSARNGSERGERRYPNRANIRIDAAYRYWASPVPRTVSYCLEHFDERKVAESLAFQRSIAVARYFVDGTDNMELLEEQEQRRVYALISNELSAL